MFKREKARMEASRVSGSAIFDLFILNWDFNSQMEFLRVSCNVDESFLLLDAKPYEPPKKECSINVKNEEQVAKAELWRTLAATLKSNQNGSGNSYHGANVGDNMPSDRVSLCRKHSMQYDQTKWVCIKEKVLDAFYDYEQQKLKKHCNVSYCKLVIHPISQVSLVLAIRVTHL